MNGLVLHLQGPMMSFGDTGFGQLREAGDFPSRSVVIGIIAAALGIQRGDWRLLELHANLRVHVAVVATGSLQIDYHTVKPAGYEDHPSGLYRRTLPGVNSVQTYRGYHVDAHHVTLVEGDDPALVSECRRALADPVYTAFIGRRSCPPATPLQPGDAEGATPVDALATAVIHGLKLRHLTAPRLARRLKRNHVTGYLDGDFSDTASASIVSHRRDFLVALPRSYVNRTVTQVDIQLPAFEFTASPPTNEEFFHAAS